MMMMMQNSTIYQNSHKPICKKFKSSQPNFSKQHTTLIILITIITLHQNAIFAFSSYPPTPPIPIPPIPTSPQISWQLNEMALFLHFGMNTFTDSEWGTGHASPLIFNPNSLNASQWVNVAKDCGFSRIIITAKHHDGFCLWPSEYTDYSVKSSSWKNGTGDVLKELSEAAKAAGVKLGVYLSPWDRHEPCYGKTFDYNEYYMGQMTELLTRYGEISEVWLDGAKGEGEKDMEYFFDDWFSLIHQLQPRAVIFSDAGPDTRWIGDEAGIAGTTCWSLFNRSATKIGDTDSKYSGQGDPLGHDWVPPECDVSIRNGWFWHKSESPKSAPTLLDLYYKSVGRNCLLLLNVPPNSSGLISQEDIRVLQEFSTMRKTIFSHNLAKNASVSASTTRGRSNNSRYSAVKILEDGLFSYWAAEKKSSIWKIYLDIRDYVTFNVLLLQEPIQMGQRIIKFHLDLFNNEREWVKVTSGTTVGYKKLLRFPSVKANRLRLVIDEARAEPLISYLGLYMDSFSIASHVYVRNSSSLVNNGSEPLLQTAHRSSYSNYM